MFAFFPRHYFLFFYWVILHFVCLFYFKIDFLKKLFKEYNQSAK